MKDELKKLFPRLQALEALLDKQEEANQKLIASLKTCSKKIDHYFR
jgi:hypothetical protein